MINQINSINNFLDSLNFNDKEFVKKFETIQNSDNFKKKHPKEHFFIQNDTIFFIKELSEILKPYSQDKLQLLLPKIIECVKEQIENNSLNKESIKKVKECLKKN